MYTRRRGVGLSRLILLGTLVGVLFLTVDWWRNREDAPPPEPTLAAATLSVSETQSPGDTAESTPAVPGIEAQTIMNASIFIPAAGVYAPVIRVYLEAGSWNVDRLGNNVGHLEGTAWFNNPPGNIVLSGHVELRDGSAGIFASLGKLNPGDLIVVSQGDEERRYSVTEIYSVKPDNLSPIYPTSTERLTLITCDSYNFLRNTYDERVIVIADRLGS